MRVGGVVLAAGESRRLGRAKQLVPFRGESLLRAIAREVCASRCDRVVVVVSKKDSKIAACVEGFPVTVLANPGWEEGMASSIRRGVQWAAEEGCDAALLLVCDQPALTAAHLDRLIESGRDGARVVASRYAGSLGVPALFARARFDALLSLRGASGAKELIARESEAASVDWPEGVIDVDTPEDAARLERRVVGSLQSRGAAAATSDEPTVGPAECRGGGR